jgi:hypothetical protein
MKDEFGPVVKPPVELLAVTPVAIGPEEVDSMDEVELE